MRNILVICVLTSAVAMVSCQRPYYAPNPVRYPDVADRFKTPQNSDTNSDVDLNNRNRDDGITTSSTSTQRIPIDALGDRDLVNRINQWPQGHQPFWYINSEAIERYRGQQFPPNNNQFNLPSRSGSDPNMGMAPQPMQPVVWPPPPPRSSFLPSRP